jgi:hypothetical protein
MAIEFESKVVAGTVLVRSAIQSPDYVPGVSGWAIMSNGSVELNNAVVRGSFDAGNGTVTANSGGFRVRGPERDMDITVTEGYIVQHRSYPQQTDFAELNVQSQPSSVGGKLRLGAPPTTVAGKTMIEGGINVRRTIESAGTVTLPQMTITAPSVSGYAAASIEMYSERDNHSSDPNVVITGDVLVDGLTSSTTEIWGSDTVTITAPNTPSALVIVFSPPLKGNTFIGFASSNTAVPGSTVTGVSISAISANGCTLWATRTNTTNTNVTWLVKATS